MPTHTHTGFRIPGQYDASFDEQRGTNSRSTYNTYGEFSDPSAAFASPSAYREPSENFGEPSTFSEPYLGEPSKFSEPSEALEPVLSPDGWSGLLHTHTPIYICMDRPTRLASV